MNQLTRIHAITVEHSVTHGFPKREFNELLLPSNATGLSDQADEPVRKR
jgi:hypothetical protein